jgi:HPt (histidine-containing phosphotransfer) domain-containing protein
MSRYVGILMSFNRPIVDQMILDVGGEAFCRLAKLFIEETAAELDAIDGLAASMRDLRELGRRAHSLKNSAGSFGLVDLAAAARDLEAASDSEDLRYATQTAKRLRIAYDADMPNLLSIVGEISDSATLQP